MLFEHLEKETSSFLYSILKLQQVDSYSKITPELYETGFYDVSQDSPPQMLFFSQRNEWKYKLIMFSKHKTLSCL